jgi:xylulokinase
MGTTSVMITRVDQKKTDIRNSLVSMPSPVGGTYLVMAENGIGGRAVEHFLSNIVFSADGFGDHSLEDRFAALHEAIANVPAGSGGVLFLPWLTGSMSPVEDGLVRGGFLNMSLDTTREHLGRAVLEGVALNMRWLRGAVEKFTQRDMDHLIFYGGGALSDAWSQIIADVQQIPIHQLANARFAVCVGTGLLGFIRCGRLTVADCVGRAPVKQIYEPNPDHRDLYDTLFGQFVPAFRQNRKIFRALGAHRWES